MNSRELFNHWSDVRSGLLAAHEIHHRGEIFLMLGLMGMEAPDV